MAFSAATGIPHPSTLKDLYETASRVLGKSAESIAAADLQAVADQAGQYLKETEPETAPEQMHAFREEFEELLRRADIDRLVVLFDDLDRCLPETAIETLEAIRLFLFVPKAAFVIAADEGMIEYAVRQHFPDLPVAAGPATYARNYLATYARNYLEKLIQVPFRLPSLGYRRVHVLLRREGWLINLKKTYRIYRELGMQLRNKTPKRRVKAKLREDRAGAVGPNDVWAMDFLHDHLATGRKIRVLTVVDTFSRFSPVLDPRFSYRGEDVVATLDRVCGQTGYPKTIRVDQGSEFISRDLDLWAYQRGVISTSRAPASRRTTRSSRRLTAGCGRNA